MKRKRTALLSVFNKTGIASFAKQLLELDFEIISSGGTARELLAAGIPVIDTGTIVGEPILGHRVVTLSREIHAGLLAQDNEADRAELERLGIRFIDLLCCDFYPLKETIENIGRSGMETFQENFKVVIENTDIGGPAMARAAAKGYRIVVLDFDDREAVINYLQKGEYDSTYINWLAAKAEFMVAEYCMRSANFRSGNGYQATLYDRTGTKISIQVC